MNDIIELMELLLQKSIAEIEQIRDEYISENGDSPNHIIQRICSAVIEKKRKSILHNLTGAASANRIDKRNENVCNDTIE